MDRGKIPKFTEFFLSIGPPLHLRIVLAWGQCICHGISVFVPLSIPLLNPYLCIYMYLINTTIAMCLFIDIRRVILYLWFILYMLSRKGDAHEL